MKQRVKILCVVGMTAMLASVTVLTGCKKDSGSGTPKIESVKFSSSDTSVVEGSTVKLTVNITPSDAEHGTITVTSKNETVATVTNSGNEITVTGVKAGKTDLVATVDNLTATCHITCYKEKYTVKLNAQKDTVEVGKTIKLTATVSPAEGVNAVWKSGDEKFAKVTGDALNGTVTGVAEGKTFIFCIVNDIFKDSCEVTVSSGVPVYPEAPDLECVKIGDTWWAPVNCGYKPASAGNKGYMYGRLYQWGRKYGQGYCQRNAKKEIIVSDQTWGDTVRLRKFDDRKENIAAGNTEADSNNRWFSQKCWYKTERIDSSQLWPEEYNPCPPGWRIPTITELTALLGGYSHSGDLLEKDGQKGIYLNGTSTPDVNGVFLPAGGFFDCSSSQPKCASRDVNGMYWSSNTYPNSADTSQYLLFNKFRSDPANGRARSTGCSVRCVQE